MGKLTTKAREPSDEIESNIEKPVSVPIDDFVGAVLGGVERARAARTRAVSPGGLPRPRPDDDWPWTVIVGFWDPPRDIFGDGDHGPGGEEPGSI